ncbi:MAG: tetratricopeptide repeat protein [Thermoguttaceae bacterium]|nr:tetratricopeptide repeat protein [Thermoguttaceae bacterium]MDW8036655.1 tetratricopeptide repeat protein [Thermoguttaceae bacterium]
MPRQGWKQTVGMVLVGLTLSACQVPGVPDHVKNNPYFRSRGDEGGWLWEKLMGQDKTSSHPQASAGPDSSTDSEQPIYPSTTPIGENLEQALQKEQAEQKKKHWFDLSALAPEKLYGKAKEAVGLGPDENLARQLFAEATELYRQGRYAEAADKFRQAAFRWPDSPLEEDALFYRAESLFFAEKYSAAYDVFDQLLKKYENSRYLERAVRRQFAIGRYWEQMAQAHPRWPIVPNLTDRTQPVFDTWGHAIKAYETVRLHDPTGPLADDALMAAGNAYFVKGRYEDAAYQYDLLRKEYPQSEHQYQAHQLGMKAKQLMYQGPLYDGTPLKEAAELADACLRLFPKAPPEERQRLLEEKNRIVEQLAEREWAMAQYYEKKRLYGAARMYYRSLIENPQFARTKYVPLAQQRLAQIQDKPDRPPDYFGWLDRIFPKGK